MWMERRKEEAVGATCCHLCFDRDAIRQFDDYFCYLAVVINGEIVRRVEKRANAATGRGYNGHFVITCG